MKKLIGVAICLAVAGVAFAAVTFDPITGTGFVGKGDVQLALGLNNAQMQVQAGSLKFTYVTTDTYTVTEVWATGSADNPKSLNTHEITVSTTIGVNGIVAYQGRQMNQITGFNLTGWAGEPAITGTVPEVDYVAWVTYTWTDNKGVEHTTDGMPVDENGNLYTEGNKKAVLSVEKTDSTGGLYVNDVLLQ